MMKKNKKQKVVLEPNQLKPKEIDHQKENVQLEDKMKVENNSKVENLVEKDTNDILKIQKDEVEEPKQNIEPQQREEVFGLENLVEKEQKDEVTVEKDEVKEEVKSPIESQREEVVILEDDEDGPPELESEVKTSFNLYDSKIGIIISPSHKEKFEKSYSGIFTKCKNVKLSVNASTEVVSIMKLMKGVDIILVSGNSKFRNDCLNYFMELKMECVFGYVNKGIKEEISFKKVPLPSIIYSDKRAKYEKFFLDSSFTLGVSTSPFWSGFYSIFSQPIIHFERDDISVKHIKSSFVKVEMVNEKISVDLTPNDHFECKEIRFFCHKHGGHIQMDDYFLGYFPCQFQIKKNIKFMI